MHTDPNFLLQTDLPFFAVVRCNMVCEAVRQAAEMERLVRNSPANIMVTYINEPFPNAWGKPERHLQRGEMEHFFECADRVIRLQNPDRVIKSVDGDYDPPSDSLPDNHCYNIWYNGHGLDLGKLHKGFWLKVKPDWMHACGEFGAEGLEEESLMRSRYPREWLPWTPEEEATWSPNSIVKAQTGRFHFMWFETPRSLGGWIAASQAHQAWGLRLMTEAFRRDNCNNSFAVHLFIDAFPSGWMKTIMDCERRPKPAFYAYRDACAPLMISLRSDRDRFFAGEPMPIELWVCNDTHELHEGATLTWHLRQGHAAGPSHEPACGRSRPIGFHRHHPCRRSRALHSARNGNHRCGAARRARRISGYRGRHPAPGRRGNRVFQVRHAFRSFRKPRHRALARRRDRGKQRQTLVR